MVSTVIKANRQLRDVVSIATTSTTVPVTAPTVDNGRMT